MRRSRARMTRGIVAAAAAAAAAAADSLAAQFRMRRFPRSSLPYRRVAGPLLNIHINAANPLSFWQHLGRIPWRRLQLKLPPNSTVKLVGHISVIGKVIFDAFFRRAVMKKCNIIE